MRRISKRNDYEPASLTQWKRQNKHKKYADLTSEIRTEIREELLEEQFYLCGHCCQQIKSVHDCHNEHIEPQQLAQKKRLILLILSPVVMLRNSAVIIISITLFHSLHLWMNVRLN